MYRHFNGKPYVFVDTYPTKATAKAKAKRIRRLGGKARVVPACEYSRSYRTKHEWDVYARQ